MDDTLITGLLNDLKSDDAAVRDRATASLWRLWFTQKGAYGLELLERCQGLMEAGEYAQAERLLTEIIEAQPDFAEAWNRRAVLHYLQQNYIQSMADCQQAIALNPIHFGALHGQGLCQAAMGDYRAAIQSFRQALEIQPYALINQKLILECTMKLG